MSNPAAKAHSHRKTFPAPELPNKHDGKGDSCTRAAGKQDSVADGKSCSTGPKSFEFVLVTDTDSRTQVRRHAMRRYVQKRRQDSIARLSTRAQVGGWVREKTPDEKVSLKEREINDDDLDRSDAHALSKVPIVTYTNGPEHNCPGIEANAQNPSNTNARGPGNALSSSHSQCIATADLQVMPSSPGSDPFDSYPFKLSQSDHRLIYHFVNTYPMMMYQMDDPCCVNPIRTIFRQIALQNTLSFQAMLAVAATHHASVEGQIASEKSLTHKMRAIRLINKHVNDDTWEKDDGMLYAVASMAVIEKWFKDPLVERWHLQGVRHLIRRRGGMRALRATGPFMERVLYWLDPMRWIVPSRGMRAYPDRVDFSSAPKAIFTAGLPWTSSTTDERPTSLPYLAPPLIGVSSVNPSARMRDLDALEIMQTCEDFLSFFHSLHESQRLLLNQKQSPSSVPACRRSKPKLFEPSAPLYDILTSLPDYDHGIRDVRFIDEYTCMACLLYLNVALHDCYRASSNFDSYLEWLNSEIRNASPRLDLSIASLLWIFLRNGGFTSDETPDEGERSWFVSRLLRVAKRLEWKHTGTIWNSLRSILLQTLATQQQCGLGSDCIGPQELLARERLRRNPLSPLWDEEQIRQNILGQLFEVPPVEEFQDSFGF